VHDASLFYDTFRHEKLSTLTGLKSNSYLYRPKIIVFRAEQDMCHAFVLLDPREKKVPMTYQQLYENIRVNPEVFENPQIKISKKVVAIARRAEKATTEADKLKELLAVMPKHCGADLSKVCMEILEN